MSLVVHKYGGTSVANLQRLRRVADIIVKARQEGQQVVAIVSAMRGESMEASGLSTDSLLQLAQVAADAASDSQLYDDSAQGREADALVSLGEMMTAPLLALILQSRGVDAVSLNAFQAGLRVSNVYGHAEIQSVLTPPIVQALDQGKVPVLAGFQGLNQDDNTVVTLGRGCSDTSAVAVSAALEAEECLIYTDVAGVYPADPRQFKGIQPLAQVSFAEMSELAYDGAPVLHLRAVNMAWQYGVPLRVLSTFAPDQPGTRILESA